jgi:uncharacterized protein YndB with AHSA1/START domain
MEIGTIEREIHIEATPDVVYQVVSTPEHLKEWWPEDAELDPVPGGTGTVTFVRPEGTHSQMLTVVEADPPRRFSFRWVYDDGDVATAGSSLLVTFDLVPSGSGTLLRFSEEGFREKGWEAAVLEKQYHDHVAGWDYFLPRLVAYADRLESAS